ncbi:helix-turn-helix domain-containing protein [Flavobacterium orientale]|uniref:Helix-turn-helix domain-containing protein n=1 Tax=Flavobacterium orientale TaxID=1756020 RepID=A0A916Y2V8_9FLAO|nr:helix-turn-helix domain-containing protein [Flavobacterium orientale]GGD28852.1 hypothetical protein GCM10011343_18760 [Flavobacterium orientale]
MEKIQFIETSPNSLANLIDEKIKIQLEDLKRNFAPKEPEEFLSRNETAKLLKISLVTLHQWSNTGIIKPMKMGNRTYFSRKELTEKMYNSNK